jgi:hypothetical protein
MKLAGIVLVIVGLYFAISGGVSYQTRDTVVDVGPVEVTKDDTKRVPVSPLAGVLITVAGIALIALARRPGQRAS